MPQIFKALVKKSPFWNLVREYLAKRDLAAWRKNGEPMPPPHLIKREEIRKIAEKHGLKILVETGTYLGDMVAAMKPHFNRIYSIELSVELYERARIRFQADRNIVLINGDSGSQIAKVVEEIDMPALFWLDGHYSAGITARGEKDTSIFEELSHILAGKRLGHVIMIDDARCFGSDPAYPSIEEITRFVKAKRQDAHFSNQFDSIRIVL
jgi:hypothetical protein